MLELSLDIILVLFGLLDPLDILAVGKTCRTLREWSSIRSVWINALNRIIAANTLLKPFFDHQDDTCNPKLSLQQIQHAATSPKRMLSLLERTRKKPHQDREITAFSRTLIPFLNLDTLRDVSGKKVRKIRKNKEAEQELILVPGGRFIIVLSTSFSRLTVIDVERFFGNKRNSAANSSSLDYTASSDCRSDIGIFRANISLDGTKLFIVVSETCPGGLDKFYLWEYSPSSHTLTMTKTASIWTFRSLGIASHHISANLFLFIADSVLYIWDFVHDKYMSWTVDLDDSVECTPQIFTDGGRIILLEFTNVKIWNIPPLVSGPLKYQDVPSISYPPTRTFPSAVSRTPTFLEKSDGTIISPDDWYSGPKHPLVFDAVIWRTDEQDQVEDVLLRQQLYIPHQPQGQEGSSSSDTREPIAFTRLQSLRKDEEMHVMPFMMCEGCIVTTCCSDKVFYTMCTPGPTQERPTEHDGLLPSELVSLGECEEEHAFRLYNFDPCSGRLCLVARDGTSVSICDYLRPPHLVAESRKTDL